MPNPGDQQKLQTAFSLHQAGRLDKAAELYRQILQGDAKNPYALHYLGLIEAASGNYEQAKALVNRSLATDPQNIQFAENYATILFQIGDHKSAYEVCERGLELSKANPALLYIGAISLFKLGRLQESVAQFDRLLLLAPNHIPAINERGSVLAELKNYDAALASFAKALTLAPQYAEAHVNIGNVHGARKSYDDALSAYDKAVALKPDLSDAWLGRGNVLAELERYEDALLAYDEALRLNPLLVDAWLGRGNVSCDLEKYKEALIAYDKALALRPELGEPLLGRGNACFGLRHYAEALAAYEKAFAQNSELAGATLGSGNVFYELRVYDKALAGYDKAIALEPDFASAWVGRGNVLAKLDRREEALAAYHQALAIEPDSATAWLARADVLFELNRLPEALAAYDKSLSINPESPEAISARIFALDFAGMAGFDEQQTARSEWWRRVGSPIAGRLPIRHLNSTDPGRRIKVGYVSSDFRHHSAALAFRPMLLRHDKTHFQITCYSCFLIEDGFTNEFRQAVDRWRTVPQLSDDELCELIQADKIDILVDLSGHTAGHRLGVFARKPVPVQVSAGATGTGLPTIDYLFSDPVICPHKVRHLFAEKVFDLPCIMTIEPLPDRLQPSGPPVLSKGYVTFGVFNRVSKISDDAVVLWARILDAIPRSKILIKHYALDDASVRAGQLERFAGHGIRTERIVFLGSTSRDEHLAAFKDVDISLDPFPQNGGISTLESLQMGVPVVALLGNSIASRTAGSILTSIGMGDWVAETVADYLAIARSYASLPEHLGSLRYTLPTMVGSSTIGNSALYTKAIEVAYRKMWTDYCRAAAG
jgi:predicted O-linked N-acetylglucosamine transferase (SPINDLY family)